MTVTHTAHPKANTGLVDILVCSCGWESPPYYDGWEWAERDWQQHVNDQNIRKKQSNILAVLRPFAVAYSIMEQDNLSDDFIIHAAKDSKGEHLYTLTVGDFKAAATSFAELSNRP